MNIHELTTPEQLGLLKEQILGTAPGISYLKLYVSKLGLTPSLVIKASLDEPTTWVNNIFQNSRHSVWIIHPDLKLTQLSFYNSPKTRKATIKSPTDIAKKLTLWAQP